MDPATEEKSDHETIPSLEEERQLDFTLDGQTALVTGGNTGIGAAVSRAFGRAGANVAINYIKQEDTANKLADTIRQSGSRAMTVRADISHDKDVRDMFQQVISHFGTVDILINNAGIEADAPLLDMDFEQWRKVMAVNLDGAFLCAREAAREFIRRGVVAERSRAAGKIIFTSSVHEIIPWTGGSNYPASKGGLMLFMKSIAQELAPRKIRVNSIGPGAIKTDINKSDWESPDAEKGVLDLIPYGRWGEPEDIAKVAIWLASDEADYITGTTIYVDGGMLLYPAFMQAGQPR
jgi:glucose 1-dehydrogenase